MSSTRVVALIALIVFTTIWIVFSVWTWRRLWPRGEGPLLQRIRRDAGTSFGFGIWLAMPVVEYVTALEGAFPANLVGSRALFQLGWHLFFGFPLCMWLGHVFGGIMRAVLGVPRDATPR